MCVSLEKRFYLKELHGKKKKSLFFRFPLMFVYKLIERLTGFMKAIC